MNLCKVYKEGKVASFLKRTADWLTMSYFRIWTVVFVCWIPPFMAAFPGIFVIDNVFQMRWFLEKNISAHHPILHTWLLGGILSVGKRVFGSYEAGLAVFSVLQMMFLSAVFAYVTVTVRKYRTYVSAGVCLLFFSIVPYHATSAFTATKDTVFAGLFLLVLVRIWKITRNPEHFFVGWKGISGLKKTSGFVVLVFLMCAFRNTGIYIFLFTVPSFVIVCRKYWKKALALCLCCILVWGIYTGPVYRLLHIESGSSAEMLSVPMQQLSRAMCNDREKLTEEEQEEIAAYIPGYSQYISRVADPVKDTFSAELFEEDPVRFIRLWIQVGLKCPVTYVIAFLQTNIGFWNPFMTYPDAETYLAYIPWNSADLEQVGTEWEGQIFMERNSLLPGLADLYEKLTESGGYNRIPGAGLLYSAATAFWLIVAAAVVCIRKKWYSTAPVFFMLVGLWGTLMLSPVVVFRYGYPLIISIPLVYIMCRQWNEK